MQIPDFPFKTFFHIFAQPKLNPFLTGVWIFLI
jgi:hypothetical protein